MRLVWCLFFAAALFGEQYGAVTLDKLTAQGLVKLSGTTIAKELTLTGSLIANGANLGSLDISGEANLTGTTVKNNSYITGSFQATKSNFLQPLILLTQKAVLTSSRLEAITIKQDGSFKGKQFLELRQGTIVNGPIHFESGKGEVLLFPGSQALGGVTGGKIVKKY